VRLLLDTHVALWWIEDRDQLAADAREAIADIKNDAHVSAASVWEVEVKRAAGRIETPGLLAEAARRLGFLELPIAWQHATTAASLPPIHRDPFDRMLVAQALEEGLVLVTRDPLVRQYPVATMPA
jgi:PIN domain nuclease of toxin-antitoxin system